jgi:hypothetical protein
VPPFSALGLWEFADFEKQPLRISCCCTLLVWLDLDIVVARWKRWPSITKEDLTLVIRRTQ